MHALDITLKFHIFNMRNELVIEHNFSQYSESNFVAVLNKLIFFVSAMLL